MLNCSLAPSYETMLHISKDCYMWGGEDEDL